MKRKLFLESDIFQERVFLKLNGFAKHIHITEERLFVNVLTPFLLTQSDVSFCV